MTLMWKEITEQPDALVKSIQSNSHTIESLVADIKKTDIRMIVIAARGTSDHAAVFGKYVFEILTGLPVVLAAPSVFTMYKKSLKLENTLVIGVSQSGRAEDVAEVLKAANESHAITVSITNFKDSPMAMISKYHLFCDTGLEKSVAATKTFTAEMYLLANLAARLADDIVLINELESVPQLLRDTFESAGEIERTVERYRFVNECFVLARGINYAVAMESALKIQETTYVRAKAFATSDFQHGPMAMIERDMPVIIYAPSGPSLDDVLELTQKIVEAKGDILIISDKVEVCAQGNAHISVPASKSDFTSPFANAAVAQMFACNLSLLKGLNPDTPRMLTKVTRTL